jgi:hypothetical protein
MCQTGQSLPSVRVVLLHLVMVCGVQPRLSCRSSAPPPPQKSKGAWNVTQGKENYAAKEQRRMECNARQRELRRERGAAIKEAELAVKSAQVYVDSAKSTDDEKKSGPSETDHLCCVKGFV